jgi:histidinol-phosphate phosphatase family protein
VRFVGIDLAWSPRNRSGGVVLSADGRLLHATAKLSSDNSVLEFIVNAIPSGRPGLVAIDAPLAVPNETGGRPCDRQLAAIFRRFEAGPYYANRRNLARYGGLRAENLTRRLCFLGFRHDPHIIRQTETRQVIEVLPHPATVSLFDLDRTLKYKARSGRDYSLRWRELEQLHHHLIALAEAEPPFQPSPNFVAMQIQGRRGRSFKEAEDLLDAVVCAYSALYAWHHGPRGYAVYGQETAQDPRMADDPVDQGHILVPMTPSMWQRIKIPRLLLLDRDGTLNQSLGSRPPNRPDEVKLLPGVAAKLHQYAAQGWRLVIVTNQGGVAFGYQTERQAWIVHQAVVDALPVQVDATYLCPHHPEGTIPPFAIDCPNRKPAPGAILDALARFQARPEDCLFVGDQESDCQAAEAAGVEFRWAGDFFQGIAKSTIFWYNRM